MSTFVDLTSGVISQNLLEPWWESVRNYALTLMLAASLFLSYNFETIGAVSCRPFNSTGRRIEYDLDFINSVCVTDYNSTLYTGTLNVVGTCLVAVIANWWLSNRKVRRALHCIRQADTLLIETRYLPNVVEEIATEPWCAARLLKPPDDIPVSVAASVYYKSQITEVMNIRGVRDAARKIWLRDISSDDWYGSSMNTLYTVSNFFSLIAISGILAATYILGLRIGDLIFTCTDPPAFSGLRYHTYTCVQIVGSQLTSFIVLYYLLGLAQAIVSLVLVIVGISRARIKSTETPIQKTMRDNQFVLELSKNATELSESTQRLITLSYEDLREKVIQAHDERKDESDIYFNDLLKALNLNGFDTNIRRRYH